MATGSNDTSHHLSMGKYSISNIILACTWAMRAVEAWFRMRRNLYGASETLLELS